MFITSIQSNLNQDPVKRYFGLAVAIIISSGLFLSFIQPGMILTDGGIFSAVAYKDLNGGTLYVDAWENKAPGIFYLLELFMIIIPNPVYAVFVMSFLIAIATGAFIFRIIYFNFKSLSLTFTLLPIALYFIIFKNNFGDGLYTEIYATFFLLVGINVSQMIEQKKTRFYLYSPALFFGISFWFKEPFLLISVILLGLHFIKNKEDLNFLKMLLVFMVPSVFFLILLLVNGSLLAFFDMLLYNFNYISGADTVSLKVKINEAYRVLIGPILPVILFTAYMTIKNLSDNTRRLKAILHILMLLASGILVVLSPHNFGHYYYPFFVFVFVFISETFGTFDIINKGFKLPLALLCIYTAFSLDEYHKPKLKFSMEPYVADRISSFLKKEKDKTLFVDYVTRGDYYIKSDKVPVTFVPVALPIHFQDNESGKINRAKIWNDLSQKEPDYLITTFTTSYFSWFLPESEYYNRNYEKIDSLKPAEDHVVILWRRKK